MASAGPILVTVRDPSADAGSRTIRLDGYGQAQLQPGLFDWHLHANGLQLFRRKTLGIQAIKIGRTVAITIVFVIVLLTTYVVHSLYLRVNVVFYSAILDGVIATVLCSALLWTAPWFRTFEPVEKLQLMIIWLLLGYSYAISVPTVLDRSLSFYILEKLEQRGGGIRENAFEQVFIKEYMPEDHLVDVRLTEQLQSGTIVIRDGCVLLTDKGRRLAHFSRFFRTNFLPKHRLLMGSYSDVLTDPFRHSATEVDYRCR